MQFIQNIAFTEVTGELVDLASKHTGIKIEYRIQAEEPSKQAATISIDPKYYINGELDRNYYFMSHGSLWAKEPGIAHTWWEEFHRLGALVTKPLNEPVMEDHEPVRQGRLYVINNNRATEFIDGERMTVGLWKALRIPNIDPVFLVKRCDIHGRQRRLPLKPEPAPSQMAGRWNEAGRHIQQARRKPRSSHKIKKVKV